MFATRHPMDASAVSIDDEGHTDGAQAEVLENSQPDRPAGYFSHADLECL